MLLVGGKIKTCHAPVMPRGYTERHMKALARGLKNNLTKYFFMKKLIKSLFVGLILMITIEPTLLNAQDLFSRRLPDPQDSLNNVVMVGPDSSVLVFRISSQNPQYPMWANSAFMIHKMTRFNKSDGSLVDSIKTYSKYSMINSTQIVNGRNVILYSLLETKDRKRKDIVTVMDDLYGTLNCNFSRKPLCLVSVDNANGNNRVNWNLNTGAEVFYIYRESTSANDYELIGTIYDDTTGYFIDTTSNPLKKSNRYRMTARYECGDITPASIPHKTIHLSASPNTTGGVSLIWDHYEGFEFSTYYIFRGTDPDSLVALDSIQASLNFYTDLEPDSGIVYYEIRAYKTTPCVDSPSYYNRTGEYMETASNRVIKPSIIIETGIDAGTALKAKIYPNPAKDKIIIEFPNAGNSSYELQLTDVFGKNVYSGRTNTSSFEIDKKYLNINSGVFWIKLTGDKTFVLKVVFIE